MTGHTNQWKESLSSFLGEFTTFKFSGRTGRVFFYTLLTTLILNITSCDDREILFFNSPFVFSADIDRDTLVLEEIYEVLLDIQMKDTPSITPKFRLNYQVNNGTGVLYKNGHPFQNNDSLRLNDNWSYQPTSIGVQRLEFTVSDQIGFQEKAEVEVEVLEFIPVHFSVTANFSKNQTFIQLEAALIIKLESDDPKMKYVLNYEILSGAGELRDNSGKKINSDHPINQGNSNWKYFPTGPDDNEILLTARDLNGEEMSGQASIFVEDRIPFNLALSVQPATIRQNKSSEIGLNITSTHPLFNTLNLTVQYSSNFESQGRLLDAGGSVISPNTSIPANRGNNKFTYRPVVPGTHNITFTVSDEMGNSENAIAVVNSRTLEPPEPQASSRFRLGLETCDSKGKCQASLFLDVDLAGSVDGDANLGGKIAAYRLVIDRIEYTGVFNPGNPRISISNGIAKYNLGEEKVYSNVVHRPNTAIQVELQDDDGLWSAPLEISAPGSLPN